MSFPAESKDDDHWNTSLATKVKVNMFDDAVGFGEMKNYFQPLPGADSEFEEDDMINFDGTPATTSATSSKTGKSTADYQTVRYRAPNAGTPTFAAAQSRQPSLVSAGGETLPYSASSPSIHEVVQSSLPGKERRQPPTLTEISKLEAEIIFLKRSLAEARSPDQPKQPVRDTVRRMISGQVYSLERYRSREDKLQLIDETIASHDGNAIIAAVLFLRDTLKPTIFNLELMRRPVAVEHYIVFLRQNNEFEKLMDLLGMLGRSEEAAMLKYKQALSSRQTETKLKNIQACHRSHFLPERSLANDAALVTEHIQLLERQLPIEAADAAEVAKGSMIFRQIPRAGPILDMPLITTLYYCCLYAYGQAENHLASPIAIKKAHKLTEKQYQWTVVRARGGKLKRWQDLEPLFTVKGWIGSAKLKGAMSFDRLVPVLKRFDAPRDVKNKYCNLIEGLDLRLEVGRKNGCHESVIDTLISMRDKIQLMAYHNSLTKNSQEWFYATDVLKTSTIKWKN